MLAMGRTGAEQRGYQLHLRNLEYCHVARRSQEECRGVWWKMGLLPAVIPKAPGTIRGFEQRARHRILCVLGREVEEDGLEQG